MSTRNPFGDAIYEKKPSGVFLLDNKEVAHTLQCCHGGEHFVSVRGSGKRRGFCTLCNKVTCGKPSCDPCVPYALKLDLADGHEKVVKHEKRLLEAGFLSASGVKLF